MFGWWRGRVPATPSFSGAKEKIFLHNIGVDKKEGVDKKQQKMIHKEGVQPSDILMQIHLCTFFVKSIFRETLIVLQQKTRKSHQRSYKCSVSLIIV